MSDKRRLPLLQATPERKAGVDRPVPETEEEEPRPPWHWVGFGVCIIFASWLPLTMLANAIVARIESAYVTTSGAPEDLFAALAALPPGERVKLEVSIALVYLAALAIGALFGGFVVGRWGGERAGVREAAIAGAATTAVVFALSWASTGFSWAPLGTAIVAVPMAAWGARMGVRRRGKPEAAREGR